MGKPEEFIALFGPSAIRESMVSGVPASITMAQAILESGWGKQAICNNMFGIKAHGWSGPVCDSDTTEWGGTSYVGQVSSFRAYPEPYGSFRDHSRFLQENANYDFLFSLPPRDYKAWAYGLKKAGYATAPDYPEKLINLIDTYNLYELDEKTESLQTIRKVVLVLFVLTAVWLLILILRKVFS